MKTLITACLLSASAALFVGCKSDDNNMVSPGAVQECGVNCEAKCCDKDKAAMGAMGETKDGCCKAKSDASMGAVSEQKQCPVSGGASMGAVSEKSGCCKGDK